MTAPSADPETVHSATGSPATLRITGEVVRSRYQAPPFAIVMIVDEEGNQQTLVGDIAGMVPGEQVTAEVTAETHAVHGEQFRVVRLIQSLPVSQAGMVRFLAGVLPDVGQVRAQAMVSRFGRKVFDVIESDHGQLVAIPGITVELARQLNEAFREWSAYRDLMSFLMPAGLSAAEARRASTTFGLKAREVLTRNPWQLARVHGIGFAKADAFALRLGKGMTSSERMVAAIRHALVERSEQGHLFSTERGLLRSAGKLARTPAWGPRATDISAAIHAGQAEGELVVEEACQQRLVWLPEAHETENAIAWHLRQRLQRPARNWPGLDEAVRAAGEDGHPATEEQLAAVRQALTMPLSVLTGIPGSGKSRTIRAIVQAAARLGMRVLLAAPTGRASARMREMTGIPATTIYSLLQTGPDSRRPARMRETGDILVLDESTMIDQDQFALLLSVLPIGMHLVLCGDIDQLRPVGAGYPFRDLLESGVCPVTRLTRPFRQSEGSELIDAALAIRSGRLPRFRRPDEEGDLLLAPEHESASLLRRVVAIVAERAPRRFGVQPDEIMVLSPMNKGPIGTMALNKALRAALNPSGQPFRIGNQSWQVGDRVIWTVNDWQAGRLNGDQGRILAWHPKVVTDNVREPGVVTVGFDDTEIMLPASKANRVLIPGFASSIHRSQGQEQQAVVIIAHPSHGFMLERTLFYTALTRARKHVIVVGTVEAVRTAVSRSRQQQVSTRLVDRLTGRAPVTPLVADTPDNLELDPPLP